MTTHLALSKVMKSLLCCVVYPCVLSSRNSRIATLKKKWKIVLSSESGGSTVEAALSAIVVITLFIGTMESCLALYTYHFTANAASEASRFAMVRGSSCSGLSSGCPAAASDVQKFVQGLGYPGMVDANLTVTTTWPTTGSSCTPSSLPCNNPGNLVQVKVLYKFPFAVPFVPFSTISMSSTSLMTISQ